MLPQQAAATQADGVVDWREGTMGVAGERLQGIAFTSGSKVTDGITAVTGTPVAAGRRNSFQA